MRAGLYRVGLYGGTFDPPHRAHRTVVEACRAQLGLERIVVLPAGTHPLKAAPARASGRDRAALCRIAFAGLAGVEVDEREIERAEVSYTVDTLRAFRRELGPDAELYFLIGSDNLGDLPRWRQHHELLRLAEFVVVPRAGHPVPPDDFASLDLTPAERTRLLAHVLEVTPSAVSSTEIRRRLAAGEDVDAWLQPEVAHEIRRRHLYGT